ncbi:lysophospholipid acyltransferase family protein [Xanthobacteraceae bacterium Astr-EGSB]|uniref:lysophospholipid acyltransferase family protein n=1 Tax=Astrobacterium formosum TaxID=3069710 RepID=UPI0027B3ED19|nr:lysophospholipid acyltransferase family protein [Xanthobacteraceae bacterium Astr-EGSB]
MARAVFALAAIAGLTLVLLPFQILAVRLKLSARRLIPVLYHRAACRILGVRVREIGARVTATPLLIVANHVSWLDICVFTSLAPVVFVAKREVGAWPVFGLLARLQRTVFVDRERRHKTGDVNAEIAARLAEGDPVVLFGEGTSSDGNRVLAFRSALLGAARDAVAAAGSDGRVTIQPAAIAYTRLQGLPLGRQHRPRVAWYGAMSLGPHLLGVAGRGAIDAVVTWGEPIAFAADGDRKMLARRLEAEVRRMAAGILRNPPQGGRRSG